MTREQERLKLDFISITGAGDSVAKFYLEAAQWDLNAAMAAFFENDASGAAHQTEGDDDNDELESLNQGEENVPVASSARPAGIEDTRVITGYKMDGTPIYDLPQGSGAGSSTGGVSGGMSGLKDLISGRTSGRGTTRQKGTGGSGGGRNIHGFGTMGAFGGGGSSFGEGGDDNDGEDDDGPQEFFAGGSRSSGQAIQGPPGTGGGGGRDEDNPLVQDILKKAMEAGRRGRDGADEGLRTASTSSTAFFKGGGNTLGSSDTPLAPNIAPQAPRAQPVPVNATQEESEDVSRDLIFWRDGFSIDDGPLLRYDDPTNAAVLRAINEGRAPMSLLNVRQNQNVEVRVARRTNEDYQPPPPKPAMPFSGQGNRLSTAMSSASSNAFSGSSSNDMGTAGNVSLPGTFTVPDPVRENATSAAAAAAAVPDGPVLSIHIRLGDGTRLKSQFSTSGTVRDLRRFIDASRPQQRNYDLQSGFPPRRLEDSELLSGQGGDKGLGGALVQQKYI